MGKKNGWQVETINLVTLFGWLNCMHCQLLNPDTEVFGLLYPLLCICPPILLWYTLIFQVWHIFETPLKLLSLGCNH